MPGLVNRAIQSFLRDTYGAELWLRVTQDARLGFTSFETMQTYPDAMTEAVLGAAARRLARPREVILEDLGNYLVSHPNLEALRRLLRFGGVTFADFLQSLDDLPGRARMAVPELDMPQLDLAALSDRQFRLTCCSPWPGYGHVMVGILRAMADDYGALAVLEHAGSAADEETITIDLLEPRFAVGRPFPLTIRGVGHG